MGSERAIFGSAVETWAAAAVEIQAAAAVRTGCLHGRPGSVATGSAILADAPPSYQGRRTLESRRERSDTPRALRAPPLSRGLLPAILADPRPRHRGGHPETRRGKRSPGRHQSARWREVAPRRGMRLLRSHLGETSPMRHRHPCPRNLSASRCGEELARPPPRRECRRHASNSIPPSDSAGGPPNMIGHRNLNRLHTGTTAIIGALCLRPRYEQLHCPQNIAGGYTDHRCKTCAGYMQHHDALQLYEQHLIAWRDGIKTAAGDLAAKEKRRLVDMIRRDYGNFRRLSPKAF